MKGIRTRTSELSLLCPLTDDEVTEKALEQAHHHTNKKAIKEQVGDLQSDLKAVQTKIDALGDILATKSVERLVRCEVVSFADQMIEITVRLDDPAAPVVVKVVKLPDSDAVSLDLAPGDDPSYEVAKVIKDHVNLTLEQRVDLALDRYRETGGELSAGEVSNLLVGLDSGRLWPDVGTLGKWTARARWHVGVWVRQMDAAEEYLPRVLKDWFDGLAAESSGESDMAAEIKARIHGVEGGLTLAQVVHAYVDDQELQEKAGRTVCALLNLKELDEIFPPSESPDDDVFLRAAHPFLIHDVDEMVELYPDLEEHDDWDPGNEANFEPIFKPAPLAVIVRDFVANGEEGGGVGCATGDIHEFLETKGESDEEKKIVDDAIAWTIAAGWIERYALNDHPDDFRLWPPLDSAENLRAIYRVIIGAPGKKKVETLRAAIEEQKVVTGE